MGGKWEELGAFVGGLSLNETRCVVGPVRRGGGRIGGGHDSVSFGIWTDLEFGPQTRNLRPGGVGAGVWRVEDGNAGGQEGGWLWAVPLSSLPPSLVSSLPPSACVHLLQLSVSPLTPSGSHRQQFQGSLVDDSSSGTIADKHAGPLEARRPQTRENRLTCEFYCFHNALYTVKMGDRWHWEPLDDCCSLTGVTGRESEMCLFFSQTFWYRPYTSELPRCLLCSPSCTWLLSGAKITWLCSLALTVTGG